ncbi:SAVED domain-containing protein [Marinomonas shanghaiensis]|uniref:SAVED domain-containing protein n=1 Tax=Marinomonas shanghaiensis TaxID=2202418 RepID=UPI000DB9EADC|nr:SAVED domain-containing protein [Marinomonas shanghaiensis]
MWERFKWLWVTAWRLKKSPYPKISIGAKLCLWPFSLSIIYSAIDVTVSFRSESPVDSISASLVDTSQPLWFSIFLMVVGAYIIHSDLKSKVRHTSRILISSMPGMSREFPDVILDRAEKEFCREAAILGQAIAGNDENIKRQVQFYNSELLVDILNRFIVHDDCKRLYFGGLARVPLLVAYGYMLKNLRCSVVYFDKFHRDGSWKLLDDEDMRISLSLHQIEDISPSQSGDVGLAIGFTTPIIQDQLPEELRANTLIMSSNQNAERNMVKNQENLNRISAEICKVIDELSGKIGCKKIHLFLSVQSTLAIDIGRRYQEGIHKNWVIHNFSPEANSYTWSLELSKSGAKYAAS